MKRGIKCDEEGSDKTCNEIIIVTKLIINQVRKFENREVQYLIVVFTFQLPKVKVNSNFEI
jgi:hypothetical protein